MASLKESVLQQVDLLQEGKVLEAFDLYFADFGVMYSNSNEFGTGFEECRKKQEPFIASASHIKGAITDLIIDEKDEFCAFRNSTSYTDASGETHQIDGVHIQMWTGEKIAVEWYFNGSQMDGVIAEGVLSNPAYILEIT